MYEYHFYSDQAYCSSKLGCSKNTQKFKKSCSPRLIPFLDLKIFKVVKIPEENAGNFFFCNLIIFRSKKALRNMTFWILVTFETAYSKRYSGIILFFSNRFFEITWQEEYDDLLQQNITFFTATELRKKEMYISIYVTWMYLVFLYIIPFTTLSVLNFRTW